MPLEETDIERDYLVELGFLRSSAQVTPNEPINWLRIDQTLMKEYHLAPWDIDRLTVTEILVLWGALVEKQETNFADALEQAKAYGKLTPQQKLEIGFRLY